MQTKSKYGLQNGLLIPFMLLSLLAADTEGCSGNKKGADSIQEGRSDAPQEPAVVELIAPSGRMSRIKVEIARTPYQRARGLMYRESLAEDAGMLFIFEREEVQSFWMKNTKISLDIFFINDKGRVVGVIENAEPYSEKSLYIDKPSRYVLETNAGLAKERGFYEGSVARFIGVE